MFFFLLLFFVVVVVVFFLFFFSSSFFSFGGHFVQPSRFFLSVLVKGHEWNTSVKLL